MSNNDVKIIGENTAVRIGIVLGFLLTFGSAVWWASSVNTKLDDIIKYQASTAIQYAQMEKVVNEITVKEEALGVRVSALESQVSKIQTEGSTSADKRLTVLEREIDSMNKK